MKRIILIFNLILFWLFNLSATQQQPDVLLIENDTLYIDVGWGHPSPLETYFSQNNIKYPFQMLHTANYRGHVATWVLKNDKLFIKEIQVNEKIHKPSEFIKTNTDDLKQNITANWFTGFLLARKYQLNSRYDIEFERYIYIKNGEISKSEQYTESDYESIKAEYDAGKKPEEIQNIEIIRDYEKYVAYHFRLHDDEEININKQKGYILRPKGGKLILQYYNDNHLKWPYNWESKDKSGVPIGSWEVVENQVYLNKIVLHTGLGFYETEIHDLEISELFKTEEKQIKANWLNGIYLIQHRNESKEYEEFEFNDYEIESIKIIKIEAGIITNQCEVSGDFNMEEIQAGTPENTKKLIAEYKELIE